MRVKVRLSASALRELTPQGAAGEHLKREADEMAEGARDEIVDVIENAPPRTGRRVRLSGGRRARASAPGEPPAEGEREYILAWNNTPAVARGQTIRAAVVNRLRSDSPGRPPLWWELEYGSENMAPRPHVRPAIRRFLPKLRLVFRGGR